MIDKTSLEQYIEKCLEGTDLFLTGLSVSPDNVVKVEIDSDTAVDIDRCMELSRQIHEEFPTDTDDYELEVGSAGITSPLKTGRQYRKYIGKELETLTADGRKIKGTLRDAGDSGFTLLVEQKVRKEGQKRPVVESVPVTLPYSEVKSTKYILQF